MKSNKLSCWLAVVGLFFVETSALRHKYKDIVKSLSPTEKYLLMRGYQAAEMKEHDKMVLSFNPSNFWNLVGSSPKNYSTVVLICDLNLDSNFYKEAMAKFREAASVHYNQYRKDSKNPWEESHPLFFVSLKINHEAEEKLDKYQLDPTVPNFVFFPASNYSKYVPFTKLDFDFPNLMAHSRPIPKALITRWISEESGVFLNERKFSNSEKAGFEIHQLLFFMSIGNVIAMVYRWNKSPEGVDYLSTCAKWIVGLVVCFTSGQMCNLIRHAPIATYSREGALQVISQGFRDQYILESCIIMGLYASVTAGVIRLIEIKDPEKVEDRKNMSYEEFQQYYFGKCIIPIGFGLFGVLFLYGYKMSLG